jgi:hypothetical protein
MANNVFHIVYRNIFFEQIGSEARAQAIGTYIIPSVFAVLYEYVVKIPSKIYPMHRFPKPFSFLLRGKQRVTLVFAVCYPGNVVFAQG